MVRRLAGVTHADEVVRLMEAMLTPAALSAAMLGAWRLGADVGWTKQFPISAGLWSHWQVWLGLAVTLKMFEKRYRRSKL